MSSLRTGVFAGLAIVLILGVIAVGAVVIVRNTSVLAGWIDEPVKLRPVNDEPEAQAKQALPQVWEHYVNFVQYPVDGFEDVLRSRLRHRQFDDLESFANDIRSKKTRVKGGRWLLKFFYDAIEEPAAGSGVDDKGWRDHFSLIEEWKTKYPKSITTRVVDAKSMVVYAWKARTNKFAPAVSDAQWKLFYERLGTAKNILVGSRDLGETCPGWYSAMLTIGNGGGSEPDDYMGIFNQAMEFEPTYDSFYYQMSVYWFPQWHGKKGEWAAVLSDVVRKQGTDEAYAMLEMTYDAVLMYDYDFEEIVPELQQYWPQIKRGFHAPDQLYKVTQGDMNGFTHMAYIAGDRDETRAMF